ncbi:MAG: nitrogen fixation protein NifZ [Methylophilus sp.]|nr:nitrogen fixation protein NifZ [Methylophilus sp.]
MVELNALQKELKGLAPKEPIYQWGQPVITTIDIVNDGSYPDMPMDSLLAAKDSKGEIVNIGVLEESGEPIYLVEFADGKVIGVLEQEIVSA